MDQSSPIVMTIEEVEDLCDSGTDSAFQMNWGAIARNTDMVSFVVERVVLNHPFEEQLSRMMGVFLWLRDVGANPLFSVIPNKPPNASITPVHACISITKDWRYMMRFTTVGYPLEDAQDLWKITHEGGWCRVVQPEICKYQLAPAKIPKDINEDIIIGIHSWMKSLNAPVFLAKLSARKIDKERVDMRMDIGPLLQSIPPSELVDVIEQINTWNRCDLLKNSMSSDGGWPDGEVSMVFHCAPPSPSCLSKRQEIQLQSLTRQAMRTTSRRL